MDKIIFEIERQIQRLQAAKQFLIDTQGSAASVEAMEQQMSAIPVKRGRGRPRKHPLPVPASRAEGTAA